MAAVTDTPATAVWPAATLVIITTGAGLLMLASAGHNRPAEGSQRRRRFISPLSVSSILLGSAGLERAASGLWQGGLPSPWQNGDVGAVGVAGSAGYNSGTFTVSGSGSDDDLGLVYMNARFYVPSIGRFVSADTIVPSRCGKEKDAKKAFDPGQEGEPGSNTSFGDFDCNIRTKT